MAFPLPDKPSIAVLPFENLSGDAVRNYLADGITENIIMALLQASGLFVIARNSTFTYKGKPVKVQEVATDPGVRYVLEGSIQESGRKVRLSAQLIDAQNGWSDRPDLSIEHAAFLAEKARALDAELPDVYALQGAIHLYRKRHEAAVASGEKAVALSPNHANNTALLAVFLHNAGRPQESIRKMKRAMRLSPYYPTWFLEELGFAYNDAEQPQAALAAWAKFLEREPSGAHAAHARLG